MSWVLAVVLSSFPPRFVCPFLKHASAERGVSLLSGAALHRGGLSAAFTVVVTNLGRPAACAGTNPNISSEAVASPDVGEQLFPSAAIWLHSGWQSFTFQGVDFGVLWGSPTPVYWGACVVGAHGGLWAPLAGRGPDPTVCQEDLTSRTRSVKSQQDAAIPKLLFVCSSLGSYKEVKVKLIKTTRNPTRQPPKASGHRNLSTTASNKRPKTILYLGFVTVSLSLVALLLIFFQGDKKKKGIICLHL